MVIASASPVSEIIGPSTASLCVKSTGFMVAVIVGVTAIPDVVEAPFTSTLSHSDGASGHRAGVGAVNMSRAMCRV